MITRREFLEILGISTAYLLIHPYVAFAGEDDIFPSGVASADPTNDSIILWTRINPEVHKKLNKNLKVYIVDDIQKNPDKVLKEKAIKEFEIPANKITDIGDYTIKFKVSGLKPGKTYFYIFEYDNSKKIGRFKTLPTEVDKYKFIFVTCQNYEDGYYPAFKYISEEDEAGFVLHLGDAIYERVYGAKVFGRNIKLPSGNNFANSLEDYRYLYKKYLSDENYQLARAMQTFIYIWDDHEFANDYYYNYGKDYWYSPSLPEEIREDKYKSLLLKKYAVKAWYEYIPADVSLDFKGHPLEWIKIYRDFKIGNLANLICLDERSYRESQCPKRYQSAGCYTQSQHTMLGLEQKRWFFDNIMNNKNKFGWNIVANEVQFVSGKIDGFYGSTDAWDGYIGEREEILDILTKNNINNIVMLTGDRHAFLAADIPSSFKENYDKVLGAEFMTGAISSINASEAGWWKKDLPKYNNVDEISQAEISQNPWTKFLNQKTWGYSVLEIDKEKVSSTFYSVNKYEKNPPKETLAKFTYKRGESIKREI